MRLDQTQIAIRERGLRELLDLALVVSRRYALGLFAVLLPPAALMAALNHFLLRNTLEYEWAEGGLTWYAVGQIVLVYLETPLATAGVTLYLGHALFEERPSLATILHDLRGRAWQLLWYALVPRAIGPALAIQIWSTINRDEESGINWLLALACILWIVRALRPFLMEVVLLERNPWTGPENSMTTSRRHKALHAESGGDLFGRALGLIIPASLFGLSLWLTAWYLRGLTTGHADFGDFVWIVLTPVALWIVAGYLTVLRFLCYLDLRIRREGWEVELRLRAVGAQLANKGS